MRSSKILFFAIAILTVVSILLNLPSKISISFFSTKIELPGFNPNFILAPFGIQKDFSFRKGLDLAGGTSITLAADMSGLPDEQKNDAVESAKSVIERRINYFGVSEPTVVTSRANNDYRIIVEIPGVTDVDQAVSLIGTTAQLSFWEESGDATDSAITDDSSLPIGLIQSLPTNPKKTNLTGNDLADSSVIFDPNTGEPQVQLIFTPEGAKKFADITKRNLEKRVAIVLDNETVQAPVVRNVISDGNAVISGGFTTETARNVVIALNAGSLPVPLSVLEQRTVGPTLGEISLNKSLVASVIGFVVIVFFMVVLYGRLGGIASLSLVLYTLFVLSIFKLVPVTLTLAGIAGFVLSIGMAVDANILIFERMKEELRIGKPWQIAVELGFARAWSSIRDSNISTIITSLILLYFGTGIVRGFAITLLIGVLISMFSAITITRTFLREIYRS